MTFKEAVGLTEDVKNAWQAGLQALRAEDRPHIEPEDTRALRGSADIDSALRAKHPQANRWDFGIAYQHTDRTDEVVYWTELHSASDSQISVVIRKARWLLQWLNNEAPLLNAFEREIVWVSSGATAMTPTAPQKKRMAQAGLRHVGSRLRIKNQRG